MSLPKVVFFLGGPGSGKGTQCNMLVDNGSDFVHLSAGDLLREERERGGEIGEMIERYMVEGLIVPHEVTIRLLHNRINENPEKTFLIDGFPRLMDQCLAFEEEVGPAKGCIVLDVPDPVMIDRLVRRGQASGRVDDNPDTIRKRLDLYHHKTVTVYDHFQSTDRLVRISLDGTEDRKTVFEKIKPAVDSLLTRPSDPSSPQPPSNQEGEEDSVESATSHPVSQPA